MNSPVRPIPIAAKYDNIPRELCGRRQWVIWRYECQGERWTKVPYQVAGPRRKASCTDPATWSSFEQVVRASAQADGIGYVFSSDDPYVGIDLDEATPDTEWAIEHLASYTEVSVGGTGAHVIIKGTLTGVTDRNRRGHFEVYDKNRFFVMTGVRRPSTPTIIELRQAELVEVVSRFLPPANRDRKKGESVGRAKAPRLSDNELLEKMFSSRNGTAIRQLWDGHVDRYPSQSEADAALCSHLAFWTGGDHEQMDTLFRQSGLMREKWEREDYRRRTIENALTSTAFYPGSAAKSSHYEEMVREDTVVEVSKKRSTDISSSPPRSFPRTDAGNAELLAHLYRDQVRYDHQQKRWLIWQGHRFAPDIDGHIYRLAKAATRARYLGAADIGDGEERRKEADFAIKSENRTRLEAMLSLAQAEPPLADAGTRWDEDPYLLGAPNGVIDLRTGLLRPGQPDDFITLAAGTSFDPQATAPRFERFLAEVFEENDRLIGLMRRAIGYALTGVTSEQCFFLLYGLGSNGKSVLLSVLLALLGDYGYAAPFSTFEYSRGSSIPNDLAQLAGRRLVVASETNEGARLNEARIKQLTGGELQSARFLNREYFTFTPRAAIFLAVNHRPQVRDDSHGFWRRVRLVPFRREFGASEIDPYLAEKLKEELPGILSWAVRGCLEWQAEGLNPPDEVTAAVADYKADSDPLAEFLAECCLEGPGVSVRASTVYERYRTWAEEHKLPERETLSSRIFGERLSVRFEKKRSGSGVTYLGLAVAS